MPYYVARRPRESTPFPVKMAFHTTRGMCYASAMRHQRVEAWEAKLNELLKRVDHTLEEQLGTLYGLHPARPQHGTTANPQHDGLFRITASFTPGFGSTLGKGYVLQFDLVTLETVSPAQRDAIHQEAVRLIRAGLAEALPDRNLEVKRDGELWKIVGDLSLTPKLD